MKRDKDWNKAKFERFIKEGRGQGELSEYKPWLTIQDIPSRGRATRIFGFKTKRIHHFFSDIQTRFFYLLEWDDRVLDIKEHYPLIDLKEVVQFNDLDLTKYRAHDGTDYILTTTFLIKVKKQDKEYLVARSVKSAYELENKSVLERFEIERRYWRNKKIDWGIVTNKEIPLIKAKNIEWIYSALEIDYGEIFSKEDIKSYCRELWHLISKNEGMNIKQIINLFDKNNCLEEGTGLLIFKYMIIKKIIEVDIEKKIDIELPSYKLIKNISG